MSILGRYKGINNYNNYCLVLIVVELLTVRVHFNFENFVAHNLPIKGSIKNFILNFLRRLRRYYSRFHRLV